MQISYGSLFSACCLWGCMGMLLACSQGNLVRLNSPDSKMRFELRIHEETGIPYYTLYFGALQIIQPSVLGFLTVNGERLPGSVRVKSFVESRVDTTWEPVYGEKSQYQDRYHQMVITLVSTETSTLTYQLQVRAYDEGIAFRYAFDSEEPIQLERELTEFALPAQSNVWVSKRAQSTIENIKVETIQEAVERPLLAQLSDSLFVAIGEAGLVDFARMKFVQSKENPATLVADLAGEVRYEGSFYSPWRFVMAGNSAGEILENNFLLLNLNEPNQLPSSDWIVPGKVLREVTLTTQGGIACVDFAKTHNMQFVEFDAGWYGNEYDEASDATTITVDPKRSKGPLDLPKVIDYANSKGIGILLYVNRRALEKQLDEVLPLLQSWGIKGVKYGFVNVGPQEWTSWLHEAVRKAADHQLMVDIHDEYRPTGYSRTYPNLMTQEGIRGDEESPDNTMVLKTLFTRMIAGAGDHTNCYFAPRVGEKMGSHASQLAKAVCIYSPWQFLYWYDRPQGSPARTGGAGKTDLFIQEVPELTFYDQLPTVWDDTKVLGGYPGSHAVIARRSEDDWFVGALNGESPRELTISLSFLEEGSAYEAVVYSDDRTIDSFTQIGIDTRSVTAVDTVRHTFGRHQGMAMIIRKIKD